MVQVMTVQTANRGALTDRLSMGLLVLTAVSGIVDAISFLGLGHVFTANMTGNVAFLAFAVAAYQAYRSPARAPRWRHS